MILRCGLREVGQRYCDEMMRNSSEGGEVMRVNLGEERKIEVL